jgi:NAD(P)-dependent dehydrogenase (short-subunit alcohol dehydrogenase family)
VTAGSLEPVGKIWSIDPAAWAENVRVNLTGSFHAVRAFLPEMIARRQGVIVLVSSVAVKVATPGWGAYVASKAGVDSFARVLQAELDQEELPIRVHVAYPGVVDTRMQERVRLLTEEQFPQVEAFRRMKDKGRLRPPEQPANLIRWLATEHAADLKGQVADLDDPDIRQRVAADLGIVL